MRGTECGVDHQAVPGRHGVGGNGTDEGQTMRTLRGMRVALTNRSITGLAARVTATLSA